MLGVTSEPRAKRSVVKERREREKMPKTYGTGHYYINRISDAFEIAAASD
jgi:hypothetical protein